MIKDIFKKIVRKADTKMLKAKMLLIGNFSLGDNRPYFDLISDLISKVYNFILDLIY